MHWRANVDEDSIAWLRLQTDGKSVNVLTHAVMAELESLIDQLESSETLTVLAYYQASQAALSMARTLMNLRR